MYKWNAQDYSKSSSEQQKWAQELISKLALKGDERVLDIGCGDGKITAQIARQLPEGCVMGIDLSEEMINFATRNFPPDRYPNLSFELKDAGNLDFDHGFDVVFSNAALHWVIDHLPVLEGVKKSLKPSGKLLFQMGGAGNAIEIFEAFDTIIKNDTWGKYFTNFPTPYAFYGPQEYEELLKQVGLKRKRVELIPKDMIHKGKEELSAWVRTTWLPYTQRIPQGSREEFIDELVDRYLESHPVDRDGFTHVQMIRLEVEAVSSIS